MRIPDFRVTAFRRSLAIFATALICIGCSAPTAQETHAQSDAAATTASAEPTLTAEPSAAPVATLSPTPEPSATLMPTLVLRVEERGGLMGPDAHSARFPAFTMLGDGRIFVPGAQIEISPGPALPSAQVRQLTEAGIMAVLNAVAATGRFAASAEWMGAQNYVADASDTVFTLNAEDRTVTITVYALNAYPPGDEPPDFPAAELAVHQALNQLVEQLTTLDSWLPAGAWAQPEWQPYVPDAIRLFARNADADPPDDGGITNQEMPWPTEDAGAWIAYPRREWGELRCGVATGSDADAWYEALSNANELTRFTADDFRYQITVRLLLPDEPAECLR